MKLFFSLIFALILAIIECSIFNDISCKTAVPMSNFNFTKVNFIVFITFKS